MPFKRTHDIYKLNKFKAPQRLKSTELDLKDLVQKLSRL